MRKLIKKWYPQASREARRKLETVLIVFVAVMIVCVLLFVALIIYYLHHRHVTPTLP